jgi:hypothetical protein
MQFQLYFYDHLISHTSFRGIAQLGEIISYSKYLAIM